MKISAILPNYNYARFMRGRLKEVLSQTFPVTEIIILDDASTDESKEIINSEIEELREKKPELTCKVIFNKENSGNVFSQWQKGIKEASGNYIWIAELDDSAKPEFLKTVLSPIEKDKDIVLSYTDSDPIGEISKKDKLRKGLDNIRRHHAQRSYIVDGKTELNKNLAVFNSIPNVSACVFKNLPELPELLENSKSFKLAGDWAFYIELSKRGKIARSGESLNFHRLSKSSVTGKTNLADRFLEIQRIHKSLINEEFITASTKKRMKRSEASLRKAWHLA